MSLSTQEIRNPELKQYVADHFDKVSRLVDLGAPLVEDDDKIVVDVDMKVGAYVIAAQPDIARVLTLTHTTVVVGTDTLGTITVTGTNIFGQTISEVLTPSADATVTSTKAFKTVTGAVGAGWVTAGGADKIKIGIGAALGLPFVVATTSDVTLGILGADIVAAASKAVGDTVELCVASLSPGTYNGTKHAFLFLVEQ